jgi:sugar/nucleoside kinase (ribokinase family)
VSSTTLGQRAADLLAAKAPAIPAMKVAIGLDGFVDSIIRVVDKRDSTEEYSLVPTIETFADRVARAAGKSTNMELWVERVKLGGNGPIMANALAAFGARVTYIGNLGYPHLHPAFEEFATRATIYSVAEPATTDALEFDDGKLMFGKRRPLHGITWDALIDRIGRERLTGLFIESQLIGLQNWTMLPFMSDIWRRVLDEICPKLPASPRRTFFFDLADPESRDPKDIRHALDLIAKFQKHFETYLGLNEKESFAIGEVLGYHGAPDGESAVQAVAQFIHDKLQIAGVVVHPRAYAVAASAAGVAKVVGPFVDKPLISTGAGDHFNAGFCLGKLIGADNEAALQLGVGTSGYYVRTAESPTPGDLADFLRTV